MKRIFKYLTITGLSGMLCLFLAIPANAQRGGGGHGGGGGGGFHGGGGGGGFHGGGGGFSGGSHGGGFSGGRSSGGVGVQRGSVQSGARSYSNVRTNAAISGSRGYAGGSRGYVGAGRGYTGAGRGYVGARGYAGAGRGYVGARGYAGGYGRGGYYGRGYGAFGAHGGFYYNRGFYGSLYYPRLGLSFGFLPYGYYPFYWGDSEFFYSNGYYYNYDNNQYTVVEPPVGAAISTLPAKAQPITINGQQYYELNGVYYLPVTKDDGTVVYQIAGKDGQLDTNTDGGGVQAGADDQGGNGDVATHPVAHIGDMIQQLPQDSRKVKINGQTLFVTPDDVYLKQTTDTNGNKAYSVVGVPGDGPGE